MTEPTIGKFFVLKDEWHSWIKTWIKN